MTWRCAWCDEPVEADEQADRPCSQPMHRDCLLRGVIGSVAHIERRCSCYVPGSTDSDPDGLTKRQAATAAVRAHAARHLPGGLHDQHPH